MDFHIKYSWQQVVVEAFLESHPELVQRKVTIAEQTVGQRLREGPRDLEEQLALRDALNDLQLLIPQKAREEASDQKKNIA